MHMEGRRLLKAKQSVIDSGVTRRAQAKVLCEALRVTVEDIARTAWLLQLTARPPPPPPPPNTDNKRRPKARRVASSDDDDGLSDFVDDADDLDAPAPKEVAAEPDTPRFRRQPMPRLQTGHLRRGPRHMGPARAAALKAEAAPPQPTRLEERVAPIEDIVVDTDSEAPASPGPDAKPRMQMVPDEMALLLERHPAREMYDAAVFYIRRMAAGGETLSECAQGEAAPGAIGLLVALRMWAEFQNWVVVAQPLVRVCYASAVARDRARKQLALILKAAGASEAETSSDAAAISQQLARLATTIVKCPVARPPAGPCRTTAKPSTAGGPWLDVPTAQLPGILSLMRDGGEAKRAAFDAFY
ncbi:hypothetical protein H4R21_003708, partial [Coemansia helicoidea]